MEITKQQTIVLKGMAILFMIWHHLFTNCTEYGSVVQRSGEAGKICVAIFLFLSGYGMTITFTQKVSYTENISPRFLKVKQTGYFLARRFGHFYRSYWPSMGLVILLGCICGYTLVEAYPHLNPFKRLAYDILGINGWNSYLTEWWFNKLIIQLWLIFPILFAFLYKRWLAMLSLIGLVALEQFHVIPIFCFIEGGVVSFFMGMIMARYPRILPKEKLVVILLSIIVVISIINHIGANIFFSLQHAPIAVLIAILIPSILPSIKYTERILFFLGSNSTEMYICHAVFLIICPQIVYHFHSPLLDFAILVSLSLIFSLIVHKSVNGLGMLYRKCLSF